jgi:hypothetical protein
MAARVIPPLVPDLELDMRVWDAVVADMRGYSEMSGAEKQAAWEKIAAHMATAGKKACELLKLELDIVHKKTIIPCHPWAVTREATSRLQHLRRPEDVSFFTFEFDLVRIRYGYLHGENQHDNNNGDILRIEDATSDYVLDFTYQEIESARGSRDYLTDDWTAECDASHLHRLAEVIESQVHGRKHFADLLCNGLTERFRTCMLRLWHILTPVIHAVQSRPNAHMDGLARIIYTPPSQEGEAIYTVMAPIKSVSGMAAFELDYSERAYGIYDPFREYKVPRIHVLRRGSVVLVRGVEEEEDL